MNKIISIIFSGLSILTNIIMWSLLLYNEVVTTARVIWEFKIFGVMIQMTILTPFIVVLVSITGIIFLFLIPKKIEERYYNEFILRIS